MCDICVTAKQELDQFLSELQAKYPGTTVEHQGKQVPVAPGHHVFTAVMVAAEEAMATELKFEFDREAARQGLTPEQFKAQLEAEFGPRQDQRRDDRAIFRSPKEATA
jgi:hypothetical protein